MLPQTINRTSYKQLCYWPAEPPGSQHHALKGRRSFRARKFNRHEHHADGRRRLIHELRGGAIGPSNNDLSIGAGGDVLSDRRLQARVTSARDSAERAEGEGRDTKRLELPQEDGALSLLGVVATESGEGLGTVERVRGGLVAGIISRVFRIDKHELKKFLCMSSMMFAIIYVFTMTR